MDDYYFDLREEMRAKVSSMDKAENNSVSMSYAVTLWVSKCLSKILVKEFSRVNEVRLYES